MNAHCTALRRSDSVDDPSTHISDIFTNMAKKNENYKEDKRKMDRVRKEIFLLLPYGWGLNQKQI